LALNAARVTVLPFNGAPDAPDTGRAARDIVTAILVKTYSVALLSPSSVDSYVKNHSLTPSEFDREALNVAAQALGVDLVVWGTVNQFTPYKFNRLMPATPPYVDLTVFAFRAGQPDIAKATGQKQGGLPATIWSRQPTFADVAEPLMAQLLSTLP
jgi:hypothetical protein